MFGGIDSSALNEESKFIPKSPYAAGKVFAHEVTKYIGNHIIYLLLMEYFSITSLPFVEKLL